ncbi:Uridine kinase-like protein 4 [Zea mays]|uniref:Uridine kinase-like protein 4 n=1 Tax=Zea mays TaxID=4577 RepID=A0A1D6KVU2_MAIZE|nr:Uridine kinase-like protein 4 [Zea mays]
MHTLIRDKDITTPDFVFYSDRLIGLVMEHGLGHLPFTEKQVITLNRYFAGGTLYLVAA